MMNSFFMIKKFRGDFAFHHSRHVPKPSKTLVYSLKINIIFISILQSRPQNSPTAKDIKWRNFLRIIKDSERKVHEKLCVCGERGEREFQTLFRDDNSTRRHCVRPKIRHTKSFTREVWQKVHGRVESKSDKKKSIRTHKRTRSKPRKCFILWFFVNGMK